MKLDKEIILNHRTKIIQNIKIHNKTIEEVHLNNKDK